MLVLEEKQHALERGASVIAEIKGFATVSSPYNAATPSAESTLQCMREALADSGLSISDIQYINAHATATSAGDAAESSAIEGFNKVVPDPLFRKQ